MYTPKPNTQKSIFKTTQSFLAFKNNSYKTEKKKHFYLDFFFVNFVFCEKWELKFLDAYCESKNEAINFCNSCNKKKILYILLVHKTKLTMKTN